MLGQKFKPNFIAVIIAYFFFLSDLIFSKYLYFSLHYSSLQQTLSMCLLCANRSVRFGANKIQVMQTAFQIPVFNWQLSFSWICYKWIVMLFAIIIYFTNKLKELANAVNTCISHHPCPTATIQTTIICCPDCLQYLTKSSPAITCTLCNYNQMCNNLNLPFERNPSNPFEGECSLRPA